MQHRRFVVAVFAVITLVGCDQRSDSAPPNSGGISPNPNHTWFTAYICGDDPHNISDTCIAQDCSRSEQSPAQVVETWRAWEGDQGPIDLHIEDHGDGRVDVMTPEEKGYMIFFTTQKACNGLVQSVLLQHKRDLSPYR